MVSIIKRKSYESCHFSRRLRYSHWGRNPSEAQTHGEPLEFTSGTQNYDFIYVTDVAKAFRLLGEKGKANKGYIIGSGAAKPLRQFVEEILGELKPTSPAKFGDVPYTGVMTSLSQRGSFTYLPKDAETRKGALKLLKNPNWSVKEVCVRYHVSR